MIAWTTLRPLPLILLLMTVWLLMLSPAGLALMHHSEHEADRFAPELAHDNHAAAMAFIKLTRGVLGVPHHGWLYTLSLTGRSDRLR